MKKVCLLAFVFLLIPIAAADISLEEKAVNNIVIKELNIPAEFEITITNDNSYGDYFMIDTLLPINITPKDKVFVPADSDKTVAVEIYADEELKSEQKGAFSFEYYAKGDKTEVKKSNMVLRFVSLEDIISIELPASVGQEDEEIPVKITLSENLEFDVELTLVSELLSYSEDFELTSEGMELSAPLKETKPKAGVYEVKATFTIGDYEFSESKDIVLESVIAVNEETGKSGYFLDYTIEETKENAGNTVTDTTIEIRKSTIASLFTKFNIEPAAVKREEGNIVYEFTKELNPGEKMTVTARTCYYLPLFIILLIAVAGWIFVYVTTPQIRITKRAVRVRTKSGIFATKIVLSVENKKDEVAELKIIDRLPPFTELVPEKFGTVSPTEIRKKTLIWHLDKLGKNEEIMFSYIVYSKVSIVGNLEIPLTYATYKDAKGNMKEAKSNRIFVLAPDTVPSEAPSQQ